MFLLGSGDIVLGLNQAMEKSMKMIKGRPAEESSALTLRDLQSRTNAEVAMVLKQLPKSERYSGQIGEFYVQTAPLEIVPLKLVTLFSEAGTRQLGIAPVTSNTRLSARSWIVWTSVGLVLLLNSFWVLETQKNLRLTSQKLADSFTALSDLNLNSALLDDQKGFMGDLFKRFNESVESLRKVLEAPRNPGSEENPNRVSVKNAEEDLQLITCKLGVLSCFDPGDSIGENLSRLSMSLVEIFGVRQVVFLFFSPSDQTLRARWVGMEAEFGSLDTRKPSVEIKKGKLFECLINSKELYVSNSPDFSHEEQDGLFSWVERNFLAAPLLDRDRVLGAILLADKPGEFSSVDRGLLLQLQEPISRVLKNLYQYEGLHKIDMLRREYCHELSRAVEAPLNRIRNEVQSILSRLGKLTPYYKQHCDTILFEVGKLYEIVREVREVEPPQEDILSATKIQDGS